MNNKHRLPLPTLPPNHGQAITAVLRQAITVGDIQAGERLDLDDLSRHFGVSRMPVRDAIKQLQAEGLVTIYPRRRVEVSRLDEKDIDELFAMRGALEKKTLERAIGRLRSEDLSKMRQILEQMDQADTTIDGWLKMNNDFHEIINAASGWERFVAQIDVLRVNVDRYLRNYLSIRGRGSPQNQHWALYEACRTGDVNEAKAIVEQHIGETAEALCNYLKEKRVSG